MYFQVIRLSTSSYHEKNFIENEKSLIQSISGASYQFKANDFKDLPTILISNSSTQFDEIPEKLLKITKLIIHPNSGHDNVDLSLANKGLTIVGGNEIRKLPVTEWILSTIFTHYSTIPFKKNWDSKREWKRSLVSDQRILIIGKGHIGETVYNSLKVINPNIQIYDPNLKSETLIKDLSSLPAGSIDCAIFCCSLSEQSTEMINKEFLKLLSPLGILVNPARGKIINQSDVEIFFKENPNNTAYLDVFPKEPLDDSDFNGENIFKSSHIAGCHKELDKEVSKYCYNVINDYLKDESSFLDKYKRVILHE